MIKVLVIEDEKIVQLNMTKILQYEGFDVVTAADGEAGIRLALEQRPDLILCDIMMPFINGYDVQTELQRHSHTKLIPFIFLTAKAERSDMRLGMNLGATDYLTKPFTSDELLEAIFSCLDRQSSLDQHVQEKVDQIKQNITTSFPERLFVPLERVRSFLDILSVQAGEHLSPALQIDLQESVKSLNSLERFLQNFMLYSFLETTKDDAQKRDALTKNCITETETIIADIARAKAKEYGRDSDIEIDLRPAQIHMLEANLTNIVEEILDNALKFSPSHTPIYVQSQVEAGRLVLQVINQSPNMANIRQEFASEKVGLGLAIVKQLVELHQGHLTFAHAAAEGVKIVIQVPIVSEQSMLAAS